MISAEKVIGKDKKDWIKVGFRYNQMIVDAIKKVPGSLYVPNHKQWAVPYEQRAQFEAIMGDFLINWVGEEGVHNGGIDEEGISKYPTVPGYSVTYDDEGKIVDHSGFKTRPWGEFQVRGFNLMVERDFLILADDAGLGKSWQVANAIEAKKKLGQLNRGIILAKASLLFNWRDEIHMHTNQKAVVVAGTQKQRDKLYNQLGNSNDWTFIIMSYETFRGDVHNLQLLDNYKPLDFCAMDEAHKIKNPQSKIGSAIHEIPFRQRYVITATPIINNPLESYNYLLFGKTISTNWWSFRNRFAIMGGYGGKEVVGYKNINELRKVIQTNMLRRRKKDKLKELPEVAFKTINLTMTPTQAKVYKGVKEEIMEDLKDTSLEKVPNALAKLLRLQQVTDAIDLVGAKPGKKNSVKLDALDEMLEDLIENSNEKVIVFSRFREMGHLMEERFKKYNPAIVHGDVDANGTTESTAIRKLKKQYGEQAWYAKSKAEQEELLEDMMTSDRQKQVYKFQNDDSCKLFIGSTSACREGLTLTKATHVVFIDCEWSPAYVEQAYSRAHRIGQKNAVTVYYLVCEGTIDEHVQETLRTKESMAQLMIDEGVGAVGTSRARQMIASMIGENV